MYLGADFLVSDLSGPEVAHRSGRQARADETVRFSDCTTLYPFIDLLTSVKAHGGTTAQLATHQESLFVVYSGTTTRKSPFTELNVSLREH